MNQLKEVLYATSYDERHHPDSLVHNVKFLTKGNQESHKWEFIILKLKKEIKIKQININQINITHMSIECFNIETNASFRMEEIIGCKQTGMVLLKKTVMHSSESSVPPTIPCSFKSGDFETGLAELEFNTIKIKFKTSNKRCKKMGFQSVQIFEEEKENLEGESNGDFSEEKNLNSEIKAELSNIEETNKKQTNKLDIIKNLKKKTGLDKISKTNFQSTGQRMIHMAKSKYNDLKNFKWKRKSTGKNKDENVSPPVPAKKSKVEQSSTSGVFIDCTVNPNGVIKKNTEGETFLTSMNRTSQELDLVACPICKNEFDRSHIENHASECNNYYYVPESLKPFVDEDDQTLFSLKNSLKNQGVDRRKALNRNSMGNSIEVSFEENGFNEEKEKNLTKSVKSPRK